MSRSLWDNNWYFFVSVHQQNKNEKKQKRDQAKAQALASKKQSDEILKSLENIIKVSNQLHKW